MASLESQELEVERANELFYRTFESLDIHEMERLWATDRPVKCIHPGWALLSGWPAVRDSWVRIFNHTSRIRFEVADVDVGVVGDIAWVTCSERISTTVDGEPQSSRVLATNIFLRGGSGWRMIHHHGSPVFTGP